MHVIHVLVFMCFDVCLALSSHFYQFQIYHNRKTTQQLCSYLTYTHMVEMVILSNYLHLLFSSNIVCCIQISKFIQSTKTYQILISFPLFMSLIVLYVGKYFTKIIYNNTFQVASINLFD